MALEAKPAAVLRDVLRSLFLVTVVADGKTGQLRQAHADERVPSHSCYAKETTEAQVPRSTRLALEAALELGWATVKLVGPDAEGNELGAVCWCWRLTEDGARQIHGKELAAL